ncbi:transposable element Tcb1 transposase [Trichonephila clavipes]|nr:transposable element Tcb1 transposase [Trichonephila clavipes]
MSVCTNSSTMFAAAWTLSSETMAAATLDAASQTEETSMHQNGRIRVRWHQGERTLAACNLHRHTGPTPGMMVWSAIAYTSRSPLVRIYGICNSAHYISGVLRPVALPFIRVLRNPTFNQGNARPYVAGMVRTFLDTGNVRLLPWPASSPDLLPIENVWSTVAERLVRHHMPVTTVDELWYRVEAAWSAAFNLCLTQCPGL